MKLILVPLEKGGEISSLYKIGAAADAIVFRRAPSISLPLFSRHACSSQQKISHPPNAGQERSQKAE